MQCRARRSINAFKRKQSFLPVRVIRATGFVIAYAAMPLRCRRHTPNATSRYVACYYFTRVVALPTLLRHTELTHVTGRREREKGEVRQVDGRRRHVEGEAVGGRNGGGIASSLGAATYG